MPLWAQLLLGAFILCGLLALCTIATIPMGSIDWIERRSRVRRPSEPNAAAQPLAVPDSDGKHWHAQPEIENFRYVNERWTEFSFLGQTYRKDVSFPFDSGYYDYPSGRWVTDTYVISRYSVFMRARLREDRSVAVLAEWAAIESKDGAPP